MTSPHLSDLRRLFYGGSTSSEYESLLAANASGITFANLVAAAAAAGEGPTTDAAALVNSHAEDADAHNGVARWGTAGMEDGLLFLQATEPANVKGIWFEHA